METKIYSIPQVSYGGKLSAHKITLNIKQTQQKIHFIE